MGITNGLTLSKAVKDRHTPLRRYLQATFPNVRSLQQEYKSNVGDLIVDTAGAPAATIGTAVDLMVRFLLEPEDVPQSARILYRGLSYYTDTVDELARI